MRALLTLAIVGAVCCGCDPSTRRLLDTPQEHQERLTCEMNEMSGGYSGKGMSAENAEAYCDKQLEAERDYQQSHKSGS